jgi:hypothetical protein
LLASHFCAMAGAATLIIAKEINRLLNIKSPDLFQIRFSSRRTRPRQNGCKF